MLLKIQSMLYSLPSHDLVKAVLSNIAARKKTLSTDEEIAGTSSENAALVISSLWVTFIIKDPFTINKAFSLF